MLPPTPAIKGVNNREQPSKTAPCSWLAGAVAHRLKRSPANFIASRGDQLWIYGLSPKDDKEGALLTDISLRQRCRTDRG